MMRTSQILTDAALLKRQKLEIEELRKKLQVIIIFDDNFYIFQTESYLVELLFRGHMLKCWSKRFLN